MVLAKNASLIGDYYDPEFVPTTNSQIQGYDDCDACHQRVYATAITYAIEYDDEAWLESGGRVAARM
jgi:hypothetical protein